MNKAVTLKGRKEGFQLILDASASIDSILEEIKELKVQLKNDTQTGHELTFFVKSGIRKLSSDEKKQIEEIIEDDHFTISSFQSEVILIDEAIKLHKASRPKLEVRTVRSGQILDIEGDLLLIGEVHPGGTVRATGSIFVIGELKGIAHAGFNGNENAIVLANFRHNAQVRIGGNVHVVEKTENSSEQSDELKFVYVNDLHIIEVSPLHNLKTIRPEIGKHSGGLF
ncbi:septum site-determining protein MinC [Alkalibacterium olivapovliticus]|uniref:Probable septum site-determining protein MinC n=1 Tax=Alkalibacterium olivapovliticus TaxID=99907 RepID=A0A2T0WB30_9LACT|nr:septum site-determining protein MinC [Alkalibacterium olivapovliticus]PRY83919.1 septum site-determining protein MinC [Alkalibacterium olivapovliticus]